MSEEPTVNTHTNRRNSPRFLRVILPFFSILVLIATFTVLLWNSFSSYSGERLYQEILQNDLTHAPKDWYDVLLSSQPLYPEIIESISQDDFEEASLQLTEILRTKKENDTLVYLMGITHLKLGHMDTAVFWLQKVVRNNQPGKILEMAQLLLGLSFVRTGKYDEAMDTFTRIINDETHPYRDEAVKAEARVLQIHRKESDIF